MRTTAQILNSYRDDMARLFVAAVRRRGLLPPVARIPTDPRAALLLGMKLGRKEGYGEGLVEGTRLGLNVGLEATDEMLSQPVIFGQMASA